MYRVETGVVDFFEDTKIIAPNKHFIAEAIPA
jgi:hypothetical protein